MVMVRVMLFQEQQMLLCNGTICIDSEHRCPQIRSCTIVIIEIALLCIPTLNMKMTKHSQSKVRQTS